VHYRQAIAAGNSNPRLQYNKGVAHYKLGQWDQAEAAFTTLLDHDQWQALASYNLGRLAEQQGQMGKARQFYEKTLAITDNDRLRSIASRKLAGFARRAPDKKSAPVKKGAALVSMGLVYDDNATGLADELASKSSDAEDLYLSLLAYGQYYLQGTAKDGVKLYGLSQTRRFDTFESFNTQITGLGLNLESPWQDWQTELGARLLLIQVDGNRLAHQFTGTGKMGRSWSGGYLETEYQLSYFAAGDDYQHLDGWQQKLSLSWKKTFSEITLEPVIAWIHNDRDDKKTAETFHSYSFDTLSLALELKADLDKRWRLYGDLSLAETIYDGKNRHNDLGGSAERKQRENTATELTLGARYRIAKHWFLKTEVNHKDSDDTFRLYSYSKNRVSFKLDYRW
ncbi:MAG: tetratricopeptide repeat protein, partial [Ketobacteraceae bacterium]|nr:tetratricopeptide repeat protein [Ketobacteraceae bacterium]